MMAFISSNGIEEVLKDYQGHEFSHLNVYLMTFDANTRLFALVNTNYGVSGKDWVLIPDDVKCARGSCLTAACVVRKKCHQDLRRRHWPESYSLRVLLKGITLIIDVI